MTRGISETKWRGDRITGRVADYPEDSSSSAPAGSRKPNRCGHLRRESKGMNAIERTKKTAVLAAACNAADAGWWLLLKARLFGPRKVMCVDGLVHVLARWNGQWFWIDCREVE